MDALVQYDASLGTAKPRAAKSIGQRVEEVGGDVLAEAGTSLAGQVVGAATGPGYFFVAPAAGSYGNYLKQQREIDRGERDKLSYGEMLVSGLINLIPASSAGKTAATVGKTIATQSAIGAAIGAGGKAAEQAIDQGKWPSLDDYQKYLEAGASGATVGAGVGAGAEVVKALSPAAKRLWSRFAGLDHSEATQRLQNIAENGTRSEREAAAEMLDEVGNRLGLVREATPKSAQESAAVMGAVPIKSARDSASALSGAPLTEAELEATRVRSLEPKSAFESGQAMGLTPVKSARESASALAQAPLTEAELEATRVRSLEPKSAFESVQAMGLAPVKSARESASTLAQAPLSEAELEATRVQSFAPKSAFEAGQVMGGVPAKSARESAAVLRGAGPSDIETAIAANRLMGPERIPPASVLESTMVKPGGKVSRDLGQVLPTTEDILNEFSVMRGVGNKKKARAMGMEGGNISAGTMAAVGAGGAAVVGGASLLKGQPEQPQFLEVELPTGQVLKYDLSDPRWKDRNDIQADANKKALEAQKIALADPHLKLAEAWAQAPDAQSKLGLMWDWMTSRRGGSIAARAGINAVGSELGPIGRVASGPLAEYVGSSIAQQPTSRGRLVGAAIENIPGGSSKFATNLLKFAGYNVAGEAARKAIDEGQLIDLKTAAKVASEGGLRAVAMKAVETGQAARKQSQRLSDDLGQIRVLQDANDAGFALNPGAFTPGAKQYVATKLAGGSTELDQFLSRVNEPVLMQKFRNVAGVTGDQQLTPALYAAKRLEAGTAYSEAAKVSPKSRVAVEDWKQANADSATAYRKYSNSADPSDLATAKAAQKRAESAFQTIENEAVAAGRPEIARDINRARVKYAQLYAMEAATNPVTGKIDNANALGFMYRDGVPFSGDLEIVARIAASQPKVLQDTSKIAIAPPSINPMKAVSPAAAAFIGSSVGQGMTRKSIDPNQASFMAQLARFGTQAAMQEPPQSNQPTRPIPYR